jgi:hypothetical protein
MSHSRHILRQLEGSLTHSNEFSEFDDEIEDENNAHNFDQKLVDSDDDDVDDDNATSMTFADFEQQQIEKRAALTSLGLGVLPKRAIDTASSEYEFVPANKKSAQSSNSRTRETVKLQPPLVADDSVRWLPVSLGGVLKQRRIGCAATSIVDQTGREPSIGVLFGGQFAEDGRVAGDGALVTGELSVSSLSVQAGKATKEQTKRRFAAKAAGLTAHTITHCAATDTLVVIGGMRQNVRQRLIYFLNAPRSPTAVWGVLHPANVSLIERFSATVKVDIRGRNNPLVFCPCDTSMNTHKVDEAILEPHYGVPDVPPEMPHISNHVSVCVGSMVVSFGGKSGDGNLFRDVLIVQGSPQGLTTPRARVGTCMSSRFAYRILKFSAMCKRVPVTCAEYEPTTSSAAVGFGVRAFVIGGSNERGEPISKIFVFDSHTNELSVARISAGRLPPLAGHSATLVRDTAIVYGGVGAAKHLLNNVFMINLTTMSVTELIVTQGVPPSPRVRHGVCAVGRDLLIFGGELNPGATDDCVLLRGIADMRSARTAVHEFGWLLDSAQFADVAIANGSLRSTAHRVVLAARCALLRELMDGVSSTARVRQLASGRSVSCERQADGSLLLTVAEAPSEFAAMIRFLYTDSVDIHDCNLEVLTRVASDFGLTGLVRMCESVADHTVVIPASTFIADFRACIGNAQFSDVCFVIDGRQIHAHRALLARCEFFAMLLGGHFREASQHTVPIVDIEYNVFVAGITYLCTGVLDTRNAQMLFELLYLSNFWNLPELKSTLETLLLPFSNSETCALFFEAAQENNCSETFKRAVTEHVKRFYFAAISRMKHSDGGDDDDDEVQQLLAVLEHARIDTTVDRRNPVEEGWIPRGGIARCTACNRPLAYEPRTWPISQPLPTVSLEKWSVGAGVPPPEFVRVAATSEEEVGFRFDVELPHLPAHQARVKVLQRFASIKLARQNAALCALHHLHACE